MKFLDPNDPFFRKPLTRWLTAGFPVVWSGVEFWMGELIWGTAFLAIGAYAAWALLINRK